jgi:hypothetical protein
MRRIAEAGGASSGVRSPKSEVRTSWAPASAGWRLAFAGAAVVLIAVTIWLAVPSRPSPQTAGNRTPHDIAPPARPSRGPGEQAQPITQAVPAPNRTPAHAASAALRPRRSTGSETRPKPEAATSEAVTSEPTEEVVPGVPPLEVQPMQDPSPVVIAPVVVSPIEIRQIQIPLVDDRIDKNSPPTKADPEKKQAGATALADR